MIDARIERYYLDFKNFKEYFVRNCMVETKYESYKVWAQWLIRNLSQTEPNYHLIPKNEIIEKDVDIFQHLKEKGISHEQVVKFYSSIKERVSKLHQVYHQVKFDFLHRPINIRDLNQVIEYELAYHNGTHIHLYRLGRIFVKYSSIVYDQLVRKYLGNPAYFRFYMFEMGFNYYMLEGQSFQWSVPPKALLFLERAISVKTELFASPANVNLRDYYSLFYVDRYFGSMGNFFGSKFEQTLEGTFEVNPPFIERLFIESSQTICKMLQKSQQLDKDLLFIYIMPDWLDSGGYQLINQSGYLIEEIILYPNDHCYYHSMKNRLITANFETHVLVIGTSKSRRRWTDQIKTRFVENFSRSY